MKKAFSLMEVLVTLTIISIMVGVASVSYTPLWQKYQVKLGVEDLAARLQAYRMSAIVRNRTVEFLIQNQTLQSRTMEGREWGQWEMEKLPENFLYFMKRSIRFSGTGFAVPTGSIEVQYGEYRQRLIINLNGRMRTSELY